MESGAGRIEFGPDRVLIRGLSLRGPNVNADISGAWPDGKTVHLAGRIWLTPRYVSQLLGGWRFLARVAGLRSIDTQFRLFGTLDRVMLSTDFTRSMFWRLGHGRIPRDVQDVLTTRRPVTSLAPTGGGP
jgi:hypothetical protein